MTKATPASGQIRSIPLTCFGKTCGSITLDIDALTSAIRHQFGPLYRGSAAIVKEYGGVARDPQGRKSIRSCALYVTKQIKATAELRPSQLALAWFDTQRRRAEAMFSSLETFGVNLDSPGIRTFMDTIAESGSKDQQARLAQLLRRHVAGVRPGPRKLPPRNITWVRTNLAAMEAAVQSARDPDDPDFDLLGQFVKRWFSGVSPFELGHKIRARRRAHEAVELLVMVKLGVGRPRAREAIHRARNPRPHRRYS